MLGFYSKETVARHRCTLVYRGYDLKITRVLADWRVEVHPKTADLPILGVSEVYSFERDQAVLEAKARIRRDAIPPSILLTGLGSRSNRIGLVASLLLALRGQPRRA